MSAEKIGPLAEAVGAALALRGLRLATAESCTGGWIAKALTDIAGSSAWFERGWVTYSNAAKHEDLGVPESLLDEHGAVSGEVVAAMAVGALLRSGAGISVAVSGVAGPAGGSVAKPVGTVWLAWAWRDATNQVPRRVECCCFPGDREAVRAATVVFALKGVLEVLPAAERAEIK